MSSNTTNTLHQVLECCRDGIVFLGKETNWGSFFMRGHELAGGVQLFGGIPAKAMSERDFEVTQQKYSVVVFVKFYSKKVLQKVRHSKAIAVLDPIDNYDIAGDGFDMILVGTTAQIQYYRAKGINSTFLLLPHHSGNLRRASAPPIIRPNRLLILGTFPKKELRKFVHFALAKGLHTSHHNIVPKAYKRPFLAGQASTDSMLHFNIIVVWKNEQVKDVCFKPSTRFIHALSIGVPVVAARSQGVLEALFETGNVNYPLLANNMTDLFNLVSLAVDNKSVRHQAIEMGVKISSAFTLRKIVLRFLHGLACLRTGIADKALLLDYPTVSSCEQFAHSPIQRNMMLQ